jgi:hypothetical protein
MLSNNPVRFHGSRSNTIELRATQVENLNFLLIQGLCATQKGNGRRDGRTDG